MSKLADEVSAIGDIIEDDAPQSAKLLFDLSDAIGKIEQWAKAYPEDVFIPMTTEDWENHHEILKGANRSGSAAAADSMRHVAVGMKNILDEVEL